MGPGSSAREKVSEPIHPQTYLIGNISAKKISKSIHVCQSYSKPKAGRFFETPCIKYLAYWIGLCLTWPILLCLDSFLYIYILLYACVVL